MNPLKLKHYKLGDKVVFLNVAPTMYRYEWKGHVGELKEWAGSLILVKPEGGPLFVEESELVPYVSQLLL